jgi:type VI protein secretion system component VasK
MAEPITEAASSSDPVADSPVLKKLEQAVAEAGESEATQTSSEESQQGSAPELGQAFQELAEKKGFKSVEDLARAYQNLEGFNTKLSQEVRAIRDEVKKVTAPKQEDPMANLPPEQQQALKLLRTVIQDEISRTIQPLREDVEVRRAGSEIERVRQTFKESGIPVSDVTMEQAVEVVQRHPSLSLEEAVKLVTYEEAKRVGEVQKNKAEVTQQKKRAFVESAQTSKTGEVDYSKLSLEELESILPSAGDFVDSRGVLRRG